MPSLNNRYPLEPAFARQVGGRFTLIMWVILNGEFSKNLAGKSNELATPISATEHRTQDHPRRDPGNIVAPERSVTADQA
jgi:hypothetical protein